MIMLPNGMGSDITTEKERANRETEAPGFLTPKGLQGPVAELLSICTKNQGPQHRPNYTMMLIIGP